MKSEEAYLPETFSVRNDNEGALGMHSFFLLTNIYLETNHIPGSKLTETRYNIDRTSPGPLELTEPRFLLTGRPEGRGSSHVGMKPEPNQQQVPQETRGSDQQR